MALVGTIKDFGLADILQLIGLQRKTGILTLEGGADKVTVKFLEGAVVGADTSLRNLEDLLGSVLVRTGRITQAQLQESLLIQKSTLQRLGYVLVKQNFISGDDLEEALRIQVTQIVYRLFRWRDGKYQFAPMDHVEYDNEHFRPISAETILMEGARMIDEWPILERRIKSPGMVFRQTASGAALDVPVASLLDADIDFGFQDAPEGRERGDGEIKISPDERDILHMVDGVATVQDIVDTSALPEFDVYRILFELSNRNLTEVVAPALAAGDATRDARGTAWASGSLQIAVIALALLEILTLGMNRFTPWRIASASHDTELLKTYASRNRLERVEQALQAFYLDRGSMPDTLKALPADGYLRPSDIMDPWGRPYAYRLDASAYELGDDVPGGRSEDAVLIRHPFSASQRMILEGGAIQQGRASGP
jgi:hypothetical protein